MSEPAIKDGWAGKLGAHLLVVLVVGGTPLAGSAAMVIEADDFDHDVVGDLPAKPTEVLPSAPAPGASAQVLDPAANIAGTGQALRLHDEDASIGAGVQYDLTRVADVPPDPSIPNGLVSAVRVDLSFAPLGTHATRSGGFRIALGDFGADQSGGTASFVDCTLWDDGTIDFRSGTGPDSVGHAVMATGNTLSIFANDHDTGNKTYTGPDGNPHLLPANAVAYWLNGSRISFGGPGYTALEDRVTANGTVWTSAHNIGRFAITSTAADTGLDYVFDDIIVSNLDSEQTPASTSWLVQPGPSGLVYAGHANHGQTNAVNTVPDFSNAGYRGGGVAIPFVPAAVTVSPSGGDDTTQIQNAINTVSGMALGPDGFRGAVVLEAGDYVVSSTLTISADGVVIRGAGSGESGGTRITYTATTQSDLFVVDSNGVGPSEVGGTRTSISDSHVPVGAGSFQVSDASGYAPGDRIMVQNTINQQWLDDRSDMSQWGWTTSTYSIKYRRNVTAVDGNMITLDAPLVQAIEDQYGGGDVFKYFYSGELRNVGLECLRLESAYANDTDENHGWDAIAIRRLCNGWVRQVTARHFGHGLVSITNASSRITVQDCAMLDHKSTTAGGRRYSFSIDESDRILMQRCLTRGGRHDFASGSRTAGPNVFVDCRATRTINDIGPHHRYATGELYDNIMGGEMNVQNRSYPDGSLQHGWSGAHIMFWNCDASSIVCDTPAGAMNWCVGSVAVKRESHRTPAEPFGIWDSHNSAVTPRSLYYAQLADRLGPNALNKVLLPEQQAGNIWSELFFWDGDGLFGDALRAWADTETAPSAGYPFAVRGVVRKLLMLDRGVSTIWTKVSGPGTVAFADHTALETAATCSLPGTYVLAVSVDDGISPATATITVTVGEGGPDTEPPAAPAGLDAVAGNAVVSLDWDDNGEVDLQSYRIYRGTIAGSGSLLLASGLGSSSYVDHSVVNGTTYHYSVTAIDINGNESFPSAEAPATPQTVSGAYLFGTNNQGLAGFTPSTIDATESWSVEPDSVRYINADIGTIDDGNDGPTENGSLLRAFTLDRSVGSSYTIEAVVTLADGYGDDNNRVGIYLFGDVPDLAAGPGENESGALFLHLNTDNNQLAIDEGLDLANLATEVKDGGDLADALYGTTLTLTANLDFVEVDGTPSIDVVFTLTDATGDVTTVSTRVVAASYTGSYFGFATRARTRGVTSSDRSNPFTMDYRSFSVTGLLTGYALWASEWGTEIGGATHDHDADGVTNLYEYATGGDPTSDDAAVILPGPGVATEGGTEWFYYSYNRRVDAAARGLTYTILSGSSLTDGLHDEVPVWSVSPPSNGFETATHRIATDTAPHAFMQLKVELTE